MNLVGKLVSFGVQQVVGVSVDGVVEFLERHFRDPGQALPRALSDANDKTWKALAFALAGDGLLDRVWRLAASGEYKGIREQVGRFLAANALSFGGKPANIRELCLKELQAARQSGLLSASPSPPDAADFRPHADPQGLVRSAEEAVAEVARGLEPDCPCQKR